MHEPDSPDASDAPDSPPNTFRRRAVLFGGAATAAVTAAGVAGATRAADATPTSAARAALPLASASPMAYAQTGTIEAANVHIVPAGEIVDEWVQDAMYALDQRLSKSHLIDDLGVAITLIDDFMASVTSVSGPTTGTIGQLGWATRSDGTTMRLPQVQILSSFPGIINLSTGSSSTGWMAINLGYTNLKACPVFVAETRLRIDALNTATDRAAVYFPLTNDIDSNEPASGCYFQYGSMDGSLDNGTWYAVCATNGNRTRKKVTDLVPTMVADTKFHRFRVASNGGEHFGGGVVSFYIDDVLVAQIDTNLPSSQGTTQSPSAWYSPTIGLRKALATTTRTMYLDYFALRWETAR